MREDPTGYNLTHGDDNDWVVTRVADLKELGRYSSRDEAIDAAETDSPSEPEPEPERTSKPVD